MSNTKDRGLLFWLVAGLSSTLVILLVVLGGATHFSSRSRHLPLRLADSVDQGASRDSLDHIFNKTLGFQKIFAINIPDRHDRRDGLSLAGAFSGLSIDYVDGIRLTDEEWTAMQPILPPLAQAKGMKKPILGSWRAHTNAIRRVVEEDLQSALIIEDDVDWDLRIHSQMRDFARATRMLMQPIAGTTDQFLDPSIPHPQPGQKPLDIALASGKTVTPLDSPYGDLDRWDVMWIGHCGCVMPDNPHEICPMGRVIQSDDITVPIREHVNTELGSKQIKEQYPDHTRVVHRSRHNMCTTAYAISQRGARRLLYEFAVHKLNSAADVLLGAICDGGRGRDLATCFTVQPPLFAHHRPAGNRSTFSDISGWGGGVNEQAFTMNVRWSTRLNFPTLVRGQTNYTDSFPDADPNAESNIR